METDHTHKIDEDSEEPWHSLFEAITAIKSADEAKKFFHDLCTPAELEAMRDRWLVVKYIKAKKPYRQINEETGVSVTTVGRVARFISHGTGGYNLIYERVNKRQDNEQRKAQNRNTKEGET